MYFISFKGIIFIIYNIDFHLYIDITNFMANILIFKEKTHRAGLDRPRSVSEWRELHSYGLQCHRKSAENRFPHACRSARA